MQAQNSGSIINLTSRGEFKAIAKAGIAMMTRQYCRYLGPYNVRVNAIAPSLVECCHLLCQAGLRSHPAAATDERIGARSQAVAVGPLTFEFFEVTEQDSVYAESLARRGDGVNDLAVADLDAEADRLESKGVQLFRRSADGASAYFDTLAEGNIMLRLVQA